MLNIIIQLKLILFYNNILKKFRFAKSIASNKYNIHISKFQFLLNFFFFLKIYS